MEAQMVYLTTVREPRPDCPTSDPEDAHSSRGTDERRRCELGGQISGFCGGVSSGIRLSRNGMTRGTRLNAP